ncbi:unnamed protein product, partial [Rotaria sp. Silwood1]
SRFHCPKGWKRVGASCYYLSNVSSTSVTANNTCNLHSNLSNLIQIQNIVELFYVAHVLSRNKLSSIMISIDPKLFKGKNLVELLKTDQNRWKQMKQEINQARIKYQNLTTRIISRLNSVGLHMVRRSRKIKQSFKQNESNETILNVTLVVHNNSNEYEYDDLDSTNESDEFERIEDIDSICHVIDWNALNDNSTIYILTTYSLSTKTLCLLSNVESDTHYDHICEYVLDFCFMNVICGRYGHCVNTLSGFKCSCSFLYGGLICDRIQRLLRFNRVHNGDGNQSSVTETNDKQQLDTSISKKIRFQWSLTSPIKHTLVRNILVALLSLLFLSTLFNIITLRYYDLFKIDKINNENVGTLTIDIIHLLKKCEKDFDYRKENLSFAPFALSLVIIFSWSIKRDKQYSNIYYGRRGLLTPIKPFHTENRFTTAAVFGIIFYAIVKIFEELFFGSYELLNRGVLIELIIRLNAPHFFFLAYIAAELCVRFVYDSIYIPLKEKQSIWSVSISLLTELEQAKYHITKLLRRRYFSSSLIITQQNTMTNTQNDKEHKSKQQNVNKQSSIKKFLESFYNWDDDFRYTTIATCTYTVAFVFLYYLAFTTFVFGFQLIIGINNHKRRHRLQMNKNIYLEVPPLENFQLDSLVSKSLHYSVKYFICLFKYCFIGIASCIIRLVLATFLNVVYMARLDYSFLGRPLENLDQQIILIITHINSTRAPCLIHRYIQKSKHSLPLSISEKSLTKVKYYSIDDLSCIPITETTQKSNLITTSIVSDNSQTTDSSKCKSRKFTISNNEIKIHKNDSSVTRQFFYTVHEQSYLTTFSQSSKINIENQADKDKDIDLSQQTIVATEKNKQAIETQKKKLQQKFIKKKISNKSNQDISKSIRSSEDNDRESIDQTSKDIPFNNTYLNTNQSLKHQQETTSISHDPIDQRIPKVLNIIQNTQIKKITTKHHDRSILTEEQCPALRETTINSLTSIPRRSRKNNFYFLLLISSDNLSVGISEQSKDSFLLGDQNNTNENNHHDIVISTNITQTGILNRPHSIFESMPLLSNHSTRPISEQIPTKQSNIENITTVNKEESKKIARNRWYLAYTIICNPYLFDLRKNLKEKCNRLYSQQNKSMNEILFRTTSINREIDAASNVLFNTSNMQRRKNKIQESYEPQLSTHHPNLSSISSDDEHLASPAEEYVAFFLQQSYIYDITEHQTSLQSAHTVQQASSELPSLQSISTTNQLMTDNPPKTSKLMNFDQHMQA